MTKSKFVLCSVMSVVFIASCSEEAGFTVKSQTLDASKVNGKEKVRPHKESDSHISNESTSATKSSGAEEDPEGSIAASSNEDPPSRMGGDEGPQGTSEGVPPIVDSKGNGGGNEGAPTLPARGGGSDSGQSQAGNGGSTPPNDSANKGTSPGNSSGNQGGGSAPVPEQDPGKKQDDLVDVGIAFIQEKSDAGYNNCLTIVLGGVEHALGCSKEGKLDREMIIQARPFPECNNVRLVFKTYSNGKLIYTRSTQQANYADNIKVTKAGNGATISFEDQPKSSAAYDGDFNDYVLTIKPASADELNFKVENSSALKCQSEQ